MLKEEKYFEYKKISKHQIDTNTHKLIQAIKSNKASSINLNYYSIVGSVPMDKQVEILSSMSKKKSRALGCFIGMMVGDAMGTSLEFSKLDYKPKDIKMKDYYRWREKMIYTLVVLSATGLIVYLYNK